MFELSPGLSFPLSDARRFLCTAELLCAETSAHARANLVDVGVVDAWDEGVRLWQGREVLVSGGGMWPAR